MSTAAQERHQQARQAYERGELQAAMGIVRECLSDDRHDGRAWEICGLIHFSGGNFAKSVSALERASLLVPLRPAGRVCLGHGYGKIGKSDLSRDLLMNLVEEGSISISLLLRVATALDELDRPDLAMEACRRAILKDEHAAQPHYDLGYYAGRCGYPDDTVESLARKAIDLAPESARYRVGLAGLLWRQDRTDEAYPLIQHLTNDDLVAIGCTCCLKRVIDLYQQAQDHRRAILCQQRLLQLEVSGGESDCE